MDTERLERLASQFEAEAVDHRRNGFASLATTKAGHAKALRAQLATIRERDATIARLLAAVREAKAALEPFAAVADRIDARGKELRVVISEHASWPSSAGAYWRARTALARLGELGVSG